MTTKIQLNQIPHHHDERHAEKSDSPRSSGEVSIPIGIADSKSTIAPAPKEDCCDYIVPPEKQPNCCRKLTPCQKTAICCGGVAVAGGGTLGALIGTGTLSATGGGLIAIIVVGACCSIKLVLGGIWCYAKFSSQDE